MAWELAREARRSKNTIFWSVGRPSPDPEDPPVPPRTPPSVTPYPKLGVQVVSDRAFWGSEHPMGEGAECQTQGPY